jgi:hypothetical protein
MAMGIFFDSIVNIRLEISLEISQIHVDCMGPGPLQVAGGSQAHQTG